MKSVIILGLGYVGLPLACAAARSQMTVYGLDVDSTKVDLINQNENPFEEQYITYQFAKNPSKIQTTTSAADCIPKSDVMVGCVPTPITSDNAPDLSAPKGAIDTIRKHAAKGSTMYC